MPDVVPTYFAFTEELVEACQSTGFEQNNFIPKFESPFGYSVHCADKSLYAKQGEIIIIKTGLIFNSEDNSTLHIDTSGKLLLKKCQHWLLTANVSQPQRQRVLTIHRPFFDRCVSSANSPITEAGMAA